VPAGKVFHSSLLRGEFVEVFLKNDCRVTGTLIEYFERNNAIVLANADYFEKNEEGKWELKEQRDLIIIKGDGWVEINVPKITKKEIRELIREIAK